MRNVLALTVGGEPDPIVKAIEQYRPDITIFFCTTEHGGGSCRYVRCRTEKGEPIVSRAGLTPEKYKIIELSEPDDFEDCFRRMSEALREHKDVWERVADYTGGTKTMSAALTVAALLQGWSLSVVTGERRDTVKVAKGTELARLVRASPFFLEQTLTQVQTLYEHHEYASAAELVEELLAEEEITEKEFKPMSTLHSFLRALAAWDRFDYNEAYQILRAVGRVWQEGCALVAQIVHCQKLNLVADLVGNALRRADQRRYEDAVLRLYRAVELLAQLRLQAQDLNTDNLDLDRLNLASLSPELAQKLCDRKEKEGRSWAGLLEAYAILAALNDPVGRVYRNHQAPLKDLLGQRNKLFLTHGLKPITKNDWERCLHLASSFLKEAFDECGLTFSPLQFPSWEEVEKIMRSA